MTLSRRAHAIEAMDDPDLDPIIYAAVLRDLARVNRWTLAARPTIAFMDRVAAAHPGRRLRVLDVGFGDGDMLRRVARWAERRGIRTELVGIDLNAKSAAIAGSHTAPADAIDYRTGDYAALAGQGWDVIMSSLVAHHMTPAELTTFLHFMETEAALGWIVNDLHRHRFAHAGYPLLAALMRWHPIVRADGRLSIARSYRPGEWPPLLAEAQVRGARVVQHFPFRLCVERLR